MHVTSQLRPASREPRELVVVLGGLWLVAFAWAPAILPYAWLRVALFIALLVALLNTV